MVADKMHALNMTSLNSNLPKGWRPIAAMLLAGCAVAWGSCGCVHREFSGGRETEVTLPKLTTLITGPVANLLTNQTDFEAECVITLAGATESPRKLSGQIFAHGGKFRLEMVSGKAKAGDAGEFGVIWDAVANRGFILSDALQGYAALKRPAQFTNRLTRTTAAEPERRDGHPIEQAEVTAIGSDGQSIALQVTRAQDWGNLPMEIRLADEPNPFDLTLTNVRLIRPAEALFLPPDGFTKYESETALLEELTAREQNVFGGGHERDRTPGEAAPPDIHHHSDSNGP